MLAIEISRPDSAAAAAIVHAYLTEVASRWYGRAATPAEIERAAAEEPFDDLQGPTGVFLLARDEGDAVACAGARFLGEVAELTKVFTLPSRRGRGAGAQLIARIEDLCRERGLSLIRLDTRAELAEACALYEWLGYVQVDAFNDEPYSDRWYAKRL